MGSSAAARPALYRYGENYYDLNKNPIVCPHCQATFDPEVLLKSRKSKPVAVEVKKKDEPVSEDIVDDDLESCWVLSAALSVFFVMVNIYLVCSRRGSYTGPDYIFNRFLGFWTDICINV